MKRFIAPALAILATYGMIVLVADITPVTQHAVPGLVGEINAAIAELNTAGGLGNVITSAEIVNRTIVTGDIATNTILAVNLSNSYFSGSATNVEWYGGKTNYVVLTYVNGLVTARTKP